MLAVVEPVVRAQGAQERLLERILGRLAAEPAAQEAEHDVAVLDVEVSNGGTATIASIIVLTRRRPHL